LVDPAANYAQGPFTGSPGPAGAHSWRPTSYDPLTGFVYIPASEAPFQFAGAGSYKFQDGVDDIGIATVAARTPTAPPREYLLAWDPLGQRAAWKVPTVGGGGVLSTAGNLVFQGQHRQGTAGELVAYRADTGERLWSYSTPNAFLTGPVTYSVAGEQYLVVMTGAGGSADLISRGPDTVLTPATGKLIAFKLDGGAVLPPDPPSAPPVQNVSVAGMEGAAQEGSLLFARYCSRCHSRDAKSRNVVPDLRRSPALTNETAWRAIVIDGALESAGMISWKQFITAADAEKIRAYVASEAARAQKP
jgi:mono/diheme cytochrome c family protein